MEDCQKTVLVTGFGPFEGHPINASSEAVKSLAKAGLDDLDARLVTELLPVEYDAVADAVPALWASYKPNLVIHCGVSSQASELTLETTGHTSGYTRADIRGCAPETGECVAAQNKDLDVLVSTLPLKQVVKMCNEAGCGVGASLSNNAGRYLCDYVYCCSLALDPNRSVFVHVPPLNKPYSAEQLARGLKQVIRLLLPSVD